VREGFANLVARGSVGSHQDRAASDDEVAEKFRGIIAEEIGGRKRSAGARARSTKIASRLAFVD